MLFLDVDVEKVSILSLESHLEGVELLALCVNEPYHTVNNESGSLLFGCH